MHNYKLTFTHAEETFVLTKTELDNYLNRMLKNGDVDHRTFVEIYDGLETFIELSIKSKNTNDLIKIKKMLK